MIQTKRDRSDGDIFRFGQVLELGLRSSKGESRIRPQGQDLIGRISNRKGQAADIPLDCSVSQEWAVCCVEIANWLVLQTISGRVHRFRLGNGGQGKRRGIARHELFQSVLVGV
jgi:hypothetical protein